MVTISSNNYLVNQISYGSQYTSVDILTTTPILGCTDSLALNYDISANCNNNACIYPILGCTDSIATNYNPTATINDGSCLYCNQNAVDTFNYTGAIQTYIVPAGVTSVTIESYGAQGGDGGPKW